MSSLESYTEGNVLNFIPVPDDGYAQTGASCVALIVSNALDIKFGVKREPSAQDVANPVLRLYTPGTADFYDMSLKTAKVCNDHFDKEVKREQQKQNAALGSFPSSGYGGSSTERYIPDATKIAHDYTKTNFVNGERSRKDFAANCFTDFMYYVAATILHCAPRNCPPKRVILPIRHLITDADDNDGSIYNFAVEVRKPNSDWQSEKLFKSDRAFGPWTTVPFHRILGGAIVANDDDKSTIDEMHGKQDGSTILLCERQVIRRFVWGFVVRGSKVEIKRSNFMFSGITNPFDISTSVGREFLIEFLVNMSYCEEYKLGFDPTVKYLPDLNCWQIAVPDKDKERLFYGFDPFHIPSYRSDHGFSKYVVAKTTKPTRNADGSAPKYKIDKNDATIKDVWKAEDEADAVKRALDDVANSSIDVQFLAGGIVQINGHDDSVKNIVGEENPAAYGDKIPPNHHRVAIQGVVEIQDKRDKEFAENKQCLKI